MSLSRHVLRYFELSMSEAVHRVSSRHTSRLSNIARCLKQHRGRRMDLREPRKDCASMSGGLPWSAAVVSLIKVSVALFFAKLLPPAGEKWASQKFLVCHSKDACPCMRSNYQHYMAFIVHKIAGIHFISKQYNPVKSFLSHCDEELRAPGRTKTL